MNVASSRQEVVKCPMCCEGQLTPHGLEVHIKTMHYDYHEWKNSMRPGHELEIRGPFPCRFRALCEWCGYLTHPRVTLLDGRKDLKAHIKYRHPQQLDEYEKQQLLLDLPIMCSICGWESTASTMDEAMSEIRAHRLAEHESKKKKYPELAELRKRFYEKKDQYAEQLEQHARENLYRRYEQQKRQQLQQPAQMASTTATPRSASTTTKKQKRQQQQQPTQRARQRQQRPPAGLQKLPQQNLVLTRSRQMHGDEQQQLLDSQSLSEEQQLDKLLELLYLEQNNQQ